MRCQAQFEARFTKFIPKLIIKSITRKHKLAYEVNDIVSTVLCVSQHVKDSLHISIDIAWIYASDKPR